MNKINVFLVNEDNDGRRLDNYLFSQFKKSMNVLFKGIGQKLLRM